MVYKFNSHDDASKMAESYDAYIEMEARDGALFIYTGTYDEDSHLVGTAHHIDVSEIDDMIIALTNIKREIMDARKVK